MLTNNEKGLLELIKWHKPANVQSIHIGKARLDMFDKAGLVHADKLCGIKFVIHPTNPMYLYVVPCIPDKKSEDKPTPHNSLWLNRKVSVVFEPFDVLYNKFKKKRIKKQEFIRNIRYYCNKCLDKYKPKSLSIAMNWGFGLTMAHEAALHNILIVGYEPRWVNKPPTRWDNSSRLDYGFITTEYEKYKATECGSFSACLDESVKNSDVCICLGDRNNKSFNSLVSQLTTTYNRCLIDEYNEEELLKSCIDTVHN